MKKRIIIVFLVLILIGILSTCIIILNSKNKEEIENILQSSEIKNAELTEYIVYGTHLNIKGEVKEDAKKVKEVNLIFASTEGKEEKVKLNYEVEKGKIKFSTSNLLNEGINLEKINIDKYIMLIEIQSGTISKAKRYSIQNKTNYKDITYYTITKNNQNNKIDIKFDEGYMTINVAKSKLPKEVYDIVIDPGHGGSDTGAKGSGYDEANLNLEYGKKVKEELEKLGLKVKITRDGTEDEENFGKNTVYNEKGRVNIVGDSKAKYVFSIHLNSIKEVNSLSGVEIYAPPKMELTLAKSFADNIVKYANTTYSDLDITYKKLEGVYVRTFRDFEIEESVIEAKEVGHKPYNITNDTPYLYMIRETGGIATRAYIDGRNKDSGVNKYYNSNIGVEAYLLELGYINNEEELKKMLRNQDDYVKGIVETVKENIL